MNEIWAKRLMAGTKQWTDCPGSRKPVVKEILKGYAAGGIISDKEYQAITGETYS